MDRHDVRTTGSTGPQHIDYVRVYAARADDETRQELRVLAHLLPLLLALLVIAL